MLGRVPPRVLGTKTYVYSQNGAQFTGLSYNPFDCDYTVHRASGKTKRGVQSKDVIGGEEFIFCKRVFIISEQCVS